MKVTVENKKGLNKDVKVFVDKKTMNVYMDEKYEEIKETVNLKGFRPGKVPREILKRQFGKAVFSEVLDKVLKETSTKALQENKIKPAGQPKLDLKTYGEDKDLEYILSVTELPKVEVKSIEKIKFDDYKVKIDNKETDKRIQDIAKNQPNFKDATNESKAKEKDLVIFDYTATVDDKPFKGGDFIEYEGTQGTVKEIQIFNSILTTIDNKRVIKPNGILQTSIVTNFSSENTRRIIWTFSIAYGDDFEKAKTILLKWIKNDKRILTVSYTHLTLPTKRIV